MQSRKASLLRSKKVDVLKFLKIKINNLSLKDCVMQ